MDCREAFRAIRSRIDGEIDRERAEELSKHLEACPSCRAQALEDLEISQAIRSAAPDLSAIPALDAEAIRLRARKVLEEEGALIRFLQKVAAAAAILAISCGSLAFIGVSRETGEAEARTSFQKMNHAAAEAPLIDRENSIMIAITRR